MFNLKLIAQILLLAVTAEQPNSKISCLIALVYDGSKLACLGFIKDSNSIIAPTSCLIGIKNATFRQYASPQRGEIKLVLSDSRRTNRRHFPFNKALLGTSTIKPPITELESLYPGGGNINPEVVSVGENLQLQVHHFTLADYATCANIMFTKGYSAKRNPYDIFCAKSINATPAIVQGAPAFLPPVKPSDSYHIAGIYVGKLVQDANTYYFFTSVFDMVKHWQ